MATNEVFEYGKKLSLPVPVGTKSGYPVTIGSLAGVALTDRDADGIATVHLEGVYKLPVQLLAGDTVAVGDRLFLDGIATVLGTEGVIFGHALEPIAANAGLVNIKVRLIGAS